MRALLVLSLVVAAFGVATPAFAQVYKWKKPDGTIVYTDNLSQLPPERRAHYNQLEEEAQKKRRELEQAIGKEELERREAEAQRTNLAKAQLEEAERQRRLAALDETLAIIRHRVKLREENKSAWRERMAQAIKKRDELYQAFLAAQEKYNGLATRANFTLLPGQADEMEQAKKDTERLEVELDQVIQEIQFTIPEEARKAGIPPGWLR
jgi:uncharacterized membrane protein